MSAENLTLEGTIIKGIGGFYYVEAAGKLYECKARGIFRKDKIIPFVGDQVKITVRVQNENTIDEILPRRSILLRPPIANIDRIFCIVSVTEPVPSPIVIDKMTVIAEYNDIDVSVILTKTDLAKDELGLVDIYTNAGFETLVANGITGEGIDEFRAMLKGKTSALAGNTGVGKSTLLNAVDSSLKLETGEISQRLGRGKHTTRNVELFEVAGGFLADTPGFAALDLSQDTKITKGELAETFIDFQEYLGMCKFTSCVHLGDLGCEIVKQVEAGNIEKTRYESYVQLYSSIKDRKEWER